MAKGRIKGWRSPKTVAKMSDEERAKYEAFIQEAMKQREEEKMKENPDYVPPETDEEGNEVSNKMKLVQRAVELSNNNKASKDADWIEDNISQSDSSETTIHHCFREGYCLVETNEDYWIRQIIRWLETDPSKVYVEDFPYTNEDMIRVRIPYSVMKRVNILKPRELSPEHLEKLHAARKAKKTED